MKRLLPLLLLTACVTPQTMRARVADYTATSQKSVQEIAGCIGSGYAKAVSVVPIEGGTSFITREGGGIVDVTVDVVDEGPQRRLSFFVRNTPIPLVNRAATIARLQACV